MKLQCPRSITTLVALACGLFLSDISRASVFTGPDGNWTVLVTGVSNTVWDLSSVPALTNVDVEVEDNNTHVVADCPIDPVIQNGIGKISATGSNTARLSVDDDSGYSEQTFDATYSLKSSMTGGNGITKGTVIQTIKGVADVEGMRRVSTSHTIKFVIDSVAGTFSSHQIHHASAAGKGSISSQKDEGPTAINDVFPGDGSWTLSMTLATTNKTVSGTATVTLNSGRVFDYTVKGGFNAKTGQSKLGLKGIGNAKGSTLQVIMDEGAVTLIKGRITGQSVTVAVP